MTDNPETDYVKKTYNITYNPQIFDGYLAPRGWLDKHPACHALFRYYLAARSTYEDIILDPIVLEGDVDPTFDFRQLFSSIAMVYAVRPEHMVRFWINVDMQCTMLQIPKMPEGDAFRFDGVPNITTKEILKEAKEIKKQKPKRVVQ